VETQQKKDSFKQMLLDVDDAAVVEEESQSIAETILNQMKKASLQIP